MNIYLDINGTLLDYRGFKPASYLKEFLSNAVNNHKVYWLSNRCRGDVNEANSYIMTYLDDTYLPLIQKIKPTNWISKKTSAIDLNSDFLWFDDNLVPSDKAVLEENNLLHRFVLVNLINNTDIFKKYLEI